MGPIDVAIRDGARWINIKQNPTLRDALSNFCMLICILCNHPTNCKELIINVPGYIGYCNASKLGAGGVWLSGSLLLPPVVWRIEWPMDIQQQMVSYDNPNGSISNLDLEMAGMLAHYLVLEHLVSLHHVHVAAWCDNTPTVSLTNKLSFSRSRVAGRLVRALALRIYANEASPLISVSIAGVDNKMADMASSTFSRHPAAPNTFHITDKEFLQSFSASFPLQGDS
jgi:hypothetical protein